MSNFKGTTDLVRSNNIMQDPVNLMRSTPVMSFFMVEIRSNLSKNFFRFRIVDAEFY